ncbi:MAG: sulfatase-like hydrolase/transferase [Verrucomicrobia bacterium]|nr:sulfatase-like hydrolase/transferase [Verrucomicrobiota bacterium]
MKRLLSIFLLLLFAITASAAKQNILLLIADDYGVDSSSLYNSTNSGAKLPPTPNIASLVTNGVVFSRAYANPVCSPTRACLLTGQFGFRTGVGDVIDFGPGLTTSAFTLPRAFTNAATGYALAQFGKWHLASGAASPKNVGGWTNYAGNLLGAIANYTNWTKTVNGTSTANYTNYATTDLVNDTTNWIAARGTNAWFVWAAFNAPHTPLHLPPTNLCPHYATLSGTASDINAHPENYYDAMMEALDTEIGRLLATVNRTNTHIIFLGDNGTPNNTLQPPFPATRGKDTLYEGGTHVPFIISGPAVASPNRTNDTFVNMVDVFATILEMAGTSVAAAVPTNVPIDGQSLLPALQTTNVLTRYAFSEIFGTNVSANASGHALHNSQFKLIEFLDKHEEFYDLKNDPYEAVNLLTNGLTAAAQSNFFSLQLKLAGYSPLAAPVITGVGKTNLQFTATVARATNLTYSLWRAATFDELAWSPQTNALVVTNGAASVSLTDTNAGGAQNFYRVVGAP